MFMLVKLKPQFVSKKVVLYNDKMAESVKSSDKIHDHTVMTD